MAKNKAQRRLSGKKLEKKLLNGEDLHISEYHDRVTGWDFLQKREEKGFEKFSNSYFHSLLYKQARERVSYIEQRLKRSRYKQIEIEDMEEAMKEDNETGIRSGQKVYVKSQDSMIIAVQVGKKPLEDGANIAAAHIDSPSIMARIKKLKQNYNMCYMPSTILGGSKPKDLFNVPLSMYFHGSVKDRRGRIVKTEFSIGEGNDEPSFIIPETSFHMEDGEPELSQLEVILGTKPYADKKYNRQKRILINVMNELNKRHRLTENDLQTADIWFVPSSSPKWVGLDYSLISAYGQDNWANAFSILEGFLNAKQPEYTKMAVFYDREETGDSGRGGLKSNFFSELMLPSLAYLRKKELGDQYRMLRHSWSLFADTCEPINSFDPSLHDAGDSPYFGSGAVITPYPGEEGNWQGHASSPEIRRAITELFKENRVKYQFGIMGKPDRVVPNSSDTFHNDIFTQAIDVGVPLLSMHRAMETTSTIDLWNMFKGTQAFYSVEDHNAYMPIEK